MIQGTRLRRLFAWLQQDPIEPELVALASEVSAAAASARNALQRLPDGTDRRRLLDECEQLERAAEDVLDPRSTLQAMPHSRLHDTIEMFEQYQVQAAVLRAAAHRLADKLGVGRRMLFRRGLR